MGTEAVPAPDTHDVVWSVSVIEIETVPDAPAVTVIWFVPVPAVTEPPVTTQAYVTPETVGTEAVKERNGTTLAGAVTTGAAGVALIMTETVAELSVQGAFEIVHRNVIGPTPPVCVKVDVPLEAFEKVPVPPETTDHAPEPVVGVFPPRLAVVALAQIVWPVPTVAVVGGCATATLTVPASDVHPDTVTTTV